jgi:hypothetical protein
LTSKWTLFPPKALYARPESSLRQQHNPISISNITTPPPIEPNIMIFVLLNNLDFDGWCELVVVGATTGVDWTVSSLASPKYVVVAFNLLLKHIHIVNFKGIVL